MSKITFAEDAWDEYLYWQSHDYEAADGMIIVKQCKGHYDDK